MRKRISHKIIVCGCFVILSLIGMTIHIACWQPILQPDVHMDFPTLSADNQTILFDYIRHEKGAEYKIATYNLTTSAVHVYENIGMGCHSPSYSRDNTKIVFVGYNAKGPNIYTMKTDGSDIRQITKNIQPIEKEDIRLPSYSNPSFSPDGKRIIFTRSGGLCDDKSSAFALASGKILNKSYCDWDVYAVNVDTGNEQRLTNYRFFKISGPHFLADGKRFIFSGDGPFYNNTSRGPKDHKEYENIYHKNYIFIMDGKKNILRPILANGQQSYKPTVSHNDTIQFLSKVNEMDGIDERKGGRGSLCYDIFLIKNNKIHRLTKQNEYIGDSEISSDGDYTIFDIYTGRKSHPRTLWIMKTDGTGIKEIIIPEDKLK